MKRFTTLVTFFCIISISMAADDPNKPQSREAKAAAAKAEKAEDAAVDTYEAAVRKAASDLIDAKIKAADAYKAALLKAKAGVNRNRQKAASEIVRKALDEEIKRIDAEIKDATARRIELLKVKRALPKWDPPQPEAVESADDDSGNAEITTPTVATLPKTGAVISGKLENAVKFGMKDAWKGGWRFKLSEVPDKLAECEAIVLGYAWNNTTFTFPKDGVVYLVVKKDTNPKNHPEGMLDGIKKVGECQMASFRGSQHLSTKDMYIVKREVKAGDTMTYGYKDWKKTCTTVMVVSKLKNAD